MSDIAVGQPGRIRMRNWRVILLLTSFLLALPIVTTKTLDCETRNGDFISEFSGDFSKARLYCEQATIGEHALHKISRWLMLP
jgi:hypothetical protein